MVKIDSHGNEQLANALIEDAVEKIKHSFKNKEPVFMVYEQQSMIGGNAIDVLAIVGVGLESLFTEVQERLGKNVANMLFDSFIKAISDARQKSSRG